ncbi:MAG TPA: hypothetical protein VGB17_17215 [Pyrinomonadaceae bacterium]
MRGAKDILWTRPLMFFALYFGVRQIIDIGRRRVIHPACFAVETILHPARREPLP